MQISFKFTRRRGRKEDDYHSDNFSRLACSCAPCAIAFTCVCDGDHIHERTGRLHALHLSVVQVFLSGCFWFARNSGQNRLCRPSLTLQIFFHIELGDSVALHYLDDYHVSWVPVAARFTHKKTISLLKPSGDCIACFWEFGYESVHRTLPCPT